MLAFPAYITDGVYHLYIPIVNYYGCSWSRRVCGVIAKKTAFDYISPIELAQELQVVSSSIKIILLLVEESNSNVNYIPGHCGGFSYTSRRASSQTAIAVPALGIMM
ncbi:MAG: hypothetical protein ACOCXT_02290 [Candidatus Dojkabacteria bacterium]